MSFIVKNARIHSRTDSNSTLVNVNGPSSSSHESITVVGVHSRKASSVATLPSSDAVCNYHEEISLPLKKPQSKPLFLPVELWTSIVESVIEKQDTGGPQLRLLNKKFKKVSDKVLQKKYNHKIAKCRNQVDELKADLKGLEAIKLPQLEHFRQFLTVPTSMENLNEIIWYTNAQVEVQSVCECLVRLFGAFRDEDSTSRIPWAELRKTMKKTEFKLWLSNLSVNVEFVDFEDAKKVEKIIRVDPLITYERLREVSMPAYRLLILVAAALQFSSITSELEMSRSKLKDAERQFERSKTFLGYVSAASTVSKQL